jgi:hypothetical protein
MKLDHKHLKTFLIIAAVVAASVAVRSIGNLAMMIAYQQPHRPQMHATKATLATPQANAAAPDPNLLGVWNGKYMTSDMGLCYLRLELKQDPDRYKGYSTFACASAAYFLPGARQNGHLNLSTLNPEEAILSGAPDNSGSIHFTIDKTVGTDPKGCVLSSFAVTPFGKNELTAEWQKGSCPPGNALLLKDKS